MCAAQCGRDQLTHFEGSAPWLPSLCWKRDVSRGAAVLVSGEEGAQAFFVLCAYEKSKQLCFCNCEGSSFALLALTRVSGKEALNAWENHREFMFGYDQGTWIGDDEIPFDQPMALEEFLETRGSRKTGANSKTSTAAKVDHGERRPRCPSRKMTACWSTSSSSQLGRRSRQGRTLG